MFSACNAVNGYRMQDDPYKKLFPHLKSVWGYNGIIPSLGPDKNNSSSAHIKAWEEASRRDEPRPSPTRPRSA